MILSRRKPLPERLPPHSIESEQAVLGCCLLSPNECVPEVMEALTRLSFYDLRHQGIFGVLCGMFDDKEPIEIITLQERLKPDGKLEQIGGISYLAGLPDTVPSAANLMFYVQIVREKYLLRRYIQSCQSIIHRVYEHDGEVDTLVDGIEREVLSIGVERTQKKETHIKHAIAGAIEVWDEATKTPGKIRGISTGFNELDRWSGGFLAGQSICLAAYSSVGKTSLACQMVEHVSMVEKHPSAIFAFEMPDIDLVMRMLGSLASIDTTEANRGELDESAMFRLATRAGKLASAPIHIIDDCEPVVESVIARARRMTKAEGVKLWVVDYLQLLRSRRGIKERHEELSQISKALKQFARDSNTSMLLVSALTKDKDGIGRIQGSGAIGYDLDQFWKLTAMTSEKDERGDIVDLLMAKHRNGIRHKTVRLRFIKQFTRFESVAREVEPEEPMI